MSQPPDSPGEAVEAGTNVLLLASGSAADGACIGMLTARPGFGAQVVSVALDRTLDDRVRVWRDHADEELPPRVAFLTVGESRRSSTTGETADSTHGIQPVLVSDLYDLSLALGGALVRFEDGRPTTLCFHSIGALLQEQSTETTAQFLGSLTRWLRTTDAVAHAHFHMDPDGHEEAIVERIRPLFDAVVEHGANGWTTTVQESDEELPGAAGTGPAGTGLASTVGTTSAEFDTVTLSRSLDRVLELLSSPRRRAVLYYHLDREIAREASGDGGDPEPVVLGRLVDYLAARERREVDRTTITASLVHIHLPKLADAGVIDYDHGDQTVRYHDNPVLWACVERTAALETELP